MKKLYILGAGGFGREVAKVAQLIGNWSDIFFIDDKKPINSKVNDIRVIGSLDDLMKLSGDVFVAIGNQRIRKIIINTLSLNNNFFFPNIIHPNTNWVHSHLNRIGIGNYLGDGVIGTINISIGDFNLINLGCLLSHDTEIASFCNLMHGVKITSGAYISDSVNIGAGACIVKNAFITPAKIIGANEIYPE
jgi:sugar O-acyltransferase (sialic acid O-acetyltransferase NeuD family)